MPITMLGRWRNFHFWLIVFLFLLLSLSYYHELLIGVPVLNKACLIFLPALLRHLIERFLYLLLMVYAGWALGIKGGSAVCLSSALVMLPQALLISTDTRDALIEIIAALIIGFLSVRLIELHRRWRRQQKKVDGIAAALRTSRKNYKELFTNAGDAIWVQDINGKIVVANKACEKLSGYTQSELVGMEVTKFLGPEALRLAREVKAKLVAGTDTDLRYEQRIIRKDGTEAIMELVTRLIRVDGKPYAFQNITRDVTEERRLRDSLRDQIQKNLKAQEEERKRIARELHDDIAQSILLTSHRIDNILSGASWRLPKDIVCDLEELYSLCNGVYRDVQRYARDLRPSILDQMGLVPALNWLAEDLKQELGIKAEVQAGKLPPLSSEMELVMFRIAQEALNNVRRHAEASEVSITLEPTNENEVKMTISDNGKGFLMPKSTRYLVKDGKLGVLGMEERARLIGGSLEVKSESGKGTIVTVEAPV